MEKENNSKKESYDTIEEAVTAIFTDKKDRKRMFSVLFLLGLVGAVVVATGTYFLLKQQAVIEQNQDIDWKNQSIVGLQLRREESKNDKQKKANEVVQKKDTLFDKKRQDDAEKVRLLFLGDLMLDRYNRDLMNRRGGKWITEKIEKLFWGTDLNVANLEGPVTVDESISIGSEEGSRDNYVFTFDETHTKEFLEYNKIGLVNLGNNHILNFGKEGLEQTKNFLSKNKFEYFGDIKGERELFWEKSINGRRIAFVSYNQFSGNGFENVKGKVEELEKVNDLTIIYAHWGTEYELNENEVQQEKAHKLIDAGADLIIGSHPHVVQSVEMYKNKAIFYSLGNFIFDQYFSVDTMTGLSVAVTISDNEKLDFTLVPLQLQKNGQIEFTSETEREGLLDRILKTSELKNEMK